MNRRERPARRPPPASAAFEQAHRRWQASQPQRRDFLALMGLLPLMLALPVQARPGPSPTKDEGLDKEPWPTLALVQDHLLPSEPDSPGARDIHATAYLKKRLDDGGFSQADSDFLLSGPGWLDDLAVKQHRRPFRQLEPERRETLLQQVARSPAGENWLAMLLGAVFEALLSAPIYGGNPNGIGWRWLRHDPGFPLPERAEQTWQALVKRR